MQRRTVVLSLCLAVICAAAASPAQAEEPRYEVYLVTMYPGDALFTGFGHIAFRVIDHQTGEDLAFDYGTYDAEDPLLAWKFLIGTLAYYCSDTTYQDMVSWYRDDFGGILLQELNLTPGQAEKLVAKVRFDCLPENAAYQYHHFYNNCSTKLRDILDELLGGALAAATRGKGAGRSIRDLIDASMARWDYSFNRWIVFGLLNGAIDGEADGWDQMFLPWYLSRELDGLRVLGDEPLVLSREVVLGVEKPEPAAPSVWPGLVVVLILLAVSLAPALLARGSVVAGRVAAGAVANFAGLAAGAYGAILVFSWAVSPYPETKSNLTMLLFHPLHFVLAWFGVAVLSGRRQFAARCAAWMLAGIVVSAAALALDLTGVLGQRIWPYALATGAVSLGSWVSFRTVIRQWK